MAFHIGLKIVYLSPPYGLSSQQTENFLLGARQAVFDGPLHEVTSGLWFAGKEKEFCQNFGK